MERDDRDTNAGARILVVEDENIVALDLRERLEGLGYRVCGMEATGDGAIGAVERLHPDLILMDIRLKGALDGIEAAQTIVLRGDFPVVFLTAYSEDRTIERARRTAPYGYILKPVQDRELDVTIRMALSKHDMDREVRAAKRWFETLIAALPDGVIATDRHGLVQLLNPAAERLTGWTAHEAEGNAVDEVAVTAPVDVLPERQALHDSNLVARNGMVTPVNLEVQPIRGEAGKGMGFVYLVRDMTDRIHYEDTLRMAKTAAESASRAKSEFFAMMTHEFRTPMNGILGMTDLLGATALAPKQQEYLEALKTAAEGLLAILNDMLDLAKIDVGKMEIVCQPFAPGPLLERTAAAYALRAKRKGLEFRIVLDPKTPERVWGDQGRMRQVVSNLLDNALKFTEKGTIELRLFAVGHSGDVVSLVVEVEDSGIGIPADHLDTIFERFEQMDRSFVRRYPGTGLGLAVCRELVELMGGRIFVESEVGKGSTFRAMIPLRIE